MNDSMVDRTPTPSRKRKNMEQELDSSNHYNQHDGTPWQAMKRLRMAGEEHSGKQAAEAWLHQPHNPHNQTRNNNHHHHHAAQQHAGQDTMSEEGSWGTPSSAANKTTPTKAAAAAEKEPQEDLDYHTVNHILGSLHYEREQRRLAQQQKKQNPQQDSGFPHQQQQQQPSSQHSHSSALPLPRHFHNQVKHLHTTSKLG